MRADILHPHVPHSSSHDSKATCWSVLEQDTKSQWGNQKSFICLDLWRLCLYKSFILTIYCNEVTCDIYTTEHYEKQFYCISVVSVHPSMVFCHFLYHFLSFLRCHHIFSNCCFVLREWKSFMCCIDVGNHYLAISLSFCHSFGKSVFQLKGRPAVISVTHS